jgi:hypothetical protein
MFSVNATLIPEEEMAEVTIQDDANGSVIETMKIPVVNGVAYPKSCNAPRWRKIDSLVKYKEGDVLVVSYPKCGTTWSEQCLLLLLNNGDPSQLDPISKNTYSIETKKGKLWFEAMLDQDPEGVTKIGPEFKTMSAEEMDAVPSPRVIKTHATPNNLLGTQQQGLAGLPSGVKVVIVARNPLDACVSCYYHPPKNDPFSKGWPFAAWANTWLSGWIASGSYFSWVSSWHAQFMSQPSDQPAKAIFVLYEAMKANPYAEVRRIADFINIPYDDDLIDRVVKLSSFEAMKAQAEEGGGDTLKHLRNGKVGDWRNHFTPEMAQVVRDRAMQELPSDLAVEMIRYVDM